MKKGIEEGKKHLKTAVQEVLLAARSLSATLSSLSVDPSFNQNYPKLGQLLQFGIHTVGEIAKQVQSERESLRNKESRSNGKIRKRKKASHH